MGAHLNRLGEAILMSTHNIGFYEDLTKIIIGLSSNTHLIFSAVYITSFISMSIKNALIDSYSIDGFYS